MKIWKPFHFLLSHFQRKLNLKTSLIDTFATFLLLSYIKVGFAAFYILIPTPVWSPDGSYTYFGSSHIGYALITLLLAFVVLIIPVILLFVYPCRCFQKCLNYFHLQLLPLHAFVDAFQGCYKDGTNGTRDCRYFAGLQLLIRLLFPFIFFMIRQDLFSVFCFGVVLCLYIILFILVQPYKVSVYNKVDASLLIILLFALFAAPVISMLHSNFPFYLFAVITCAVCVFVPLVCSTLWSVLQVKRIIAHRTWCREHTQETDQLLPHVQ